MIFKIKKIVKRSSSFDFAICLVYIESGSKYSECIYVLASGSRAFLVLRPAYGKPNQTPQSCSWAYEYCSIFTPSLVQTSLFPLLQFSLALEKSIHVLLLYSLLIDLRAQARAVSQRGQQIFECLQNELFKSGTACVLVPVKNKTGIHLKVFLNS